MKRIASRANPRFKLLRSLAIDHREQRRQGLCLIEGSHLVTAYADKIGPPECLIVAESALAQAEVAALVERLGGVESLLLADALLASLSELKTPAGIMALVLIPGTRAATAASCLLLDAIQDAGNVGAILRSAAAAGIRDVHLGAGCAAVWMPRVLRAAQGAHFDLALSEQADLLQLAQGFPGRVVAATAGGGEDLFRLELTGPVAWLFGNEGSGVSSELLALATTRASIPMAAGSESLNVAAAAAVCMFEEVRQKRLAGLGNV